MRNYLSEFLWNITNSLYFIDSAHHVCLCLLIYMVDTFCLLNPLFFLVTSMSITWNQHVLLMTSWIFLLSVESVPATFLFYLEYVITCWYRLKWIRISNSRFVFWASRKSLFIFDVCYAGLWHCIALLAFVFLLVGGFLVVFCWVVLSISELLCFWSIVWVTVS